ncbi:MAG: hypothetical protein RIQ93_1570, partial [Verrucomicrobiota bacterium]
VADEEAVGEVLEVAESLEGLGVEELVAVSLLAAEVVSLVERPVEFSVSDELALLDGDWLELLVVSVLELEGLE